MKNKIEVSDQEFFQKRYEIAKDILSNIITHDNIDSINENKRQASLIFNCVSMADALLKELGYFHANLSKDETSMYKLSDLLKKDEE